MKKILLFLICCATITISFAQKETYDVISYHAPSGWTKGTQENLVSFTAVKNNNWCRINIVKSTTSLGDINKDFENEWKELVVKSYKPTEEPQLNEIIETDGWKIKAGGASFSFNKSNATVLLTTATGYNRCISIVASTNNQHYLKDVEALLTSVKLIKPEINVSEAPATNDDKNSVFGTWGISIVVPYRRGTEGSAGSTIRQYTFNKNGTYTFYMKTFRYSVSKLILTKESGTYEVSSDNISIIPKKAVIEAWSKKDDSDKWGTLLSSQNKPLEIVTYKFTKHYSSGVQEWNLVLQANSETQRDGRYSNSSNFSKAWLYGPLCNDCLIKLPQ